MRDEEPIPLISRRRLKSLGEFARPWWFPRFVLHEEAQGGLTPAIAVVVGLAVGGAIGLLLI